MNQPSPSQPVLILGAGVNGCAVARELILNGVPVVIVDSADIARGATAKSSRLIHGGVRYLEYADFHLVSESLEERERQLKLMPQFVRPLRLHIPVRRRLGGLLQSALRFLGVTRFRWGQQLSSALSPASGRGLVTVRFGLWMYDLIARSSLLPRHSVHRIGVPAAPSIDTTKYRWVCSYSDAQMLYPERFVISLLQDARAHAAEHAIEFRVLPYHRCSLVGQQARIVPEALPGVVRDSGAFEFEPSVIVNATGAWGDLTLQTLGTTTPRLFGGTKGSHIVTRHSQLRSAIGSDGIYAESGDGRLVFVLPFGSSTLVGTTDLRFEGSPGDVRAEPDEVRYLLDMVNSLFANFELTESDVDAHYCGVRPLPYVPAGKTGSIPRGHSMHTTEHAGVLVHTLIGGKLTTWRAFGAEVADEVLGNLGRQRTVDTADRSLPGAERFPEDAEKWIREAAAETGQTEQTIRFLFERMGTSARRLTGSRVGSDEPHPSFPIPPSVVADIIRDEWVTTINDLIERRLCLVFDGSITRQSVEALADCLIQAGRLDPSARDDAIQRCGALLDSLYGISLDFAN